MRAQRKKPENTQKHIILAGRRLRSTRNDTEQPVSSWFILISRQTCSVVSVSIEDKIQMTPIGFVHRERPDEDVKDRRIVSRVVLDAKFSEGLSGIDAFSHVYVIFWLNRVERADDVTLKTHVLGNPNLPFVGIFATRSPNRPNPIGQTLVELVKREDNVLWVRGLDAYDGTPILDIKPYPDWDRGKWMVVTKYRAPEWLRNINK